MLLMKKLVRYFIITYDKNLDIENHINFFLDKPIILYFYQFFQKYNKNQFEKLIFSHI